MERVARLLIWVFWLEVVLIILTVLFAYASEGYIVVLPLIGAMINGSVLIVLSYLYSLKMSVENSQKNFSRALLLSVALIGLPMMGIYYSSIGDNRENLFIISSVALVIGLLVSMLIIYRYFKNTIR